MKNVNKESKIWKWVLSTCAIAAITAGAGVGVGYAVWHNEITTPQPPNVKKDLFFTTGDTITTPNSKKSFYGTVYASNFTLSDDLKVKVDGNTSSTWTAITFDNKTHIKITPPGNLASNGKYQISIYDSQNDITSNAIGFSCKAKMNVENGKYMKIDEAGGVTIANIEATLNLNGDNLIGLYFADNTTLHTLDCNENKLTSLDVSGCGDLEYLSCNRNQLTSLDVSGCNNLEQLYCNTNSLTSLDVSNNTKLNHLQCSFNQLPLLDLSNNIGMQELRIAKNSLTFLDISHNNGLDELACDDNHLASLVVSNEANLTQLSCSSNWLTSLNVSSIAKLTRLDCSFNFLSSLDVSNNKLTILDCSYNSFLSAINLPKTTDTLSFNWDNLAKDCAASGTVQRAVNTTIDGTKPVSWNETIY